MKLSSRKVKNAFKSECIILPKLLLMMSKNFLLESKENIFFLTFRIGKLLHN